MTAAGLLVLRLTLAAVTLAHGLHVVFGIGGGPGPGVGGIEMTAARLQTAGLGGGEIVPLLTGILQLAGGVLLVVGWLSRWAAAALAIHTGVLAWVMHWPWGFFLNWTSAPGRGHGIEYALILIAGLLCVALAGPGDWSFEGRRSRHAASRAAGRARAMRRG